MRTLALLVLISVLLIPAAASSLLCNACHAAYSLLRAVFHSDLGSF